MPAYTHEQLSDLANIRESITRYTHGLDRLDPDHMRTAYWPDATDDHGPEFNGNAWEYVDVAMQTHLRWRSSMHCVLNHVVELDPGGTTARGEAYCVAFLFDAESPILHTWCGRYLDRYEKRDDEWRIIERVLVHEGSVTDDPLHAMPFPMDMFRQGSFDRPSSLRPIGP
jgi:hypothetical protein